MKHLSILLGAISFVLVLGCSPESQQERVGAESPTNQADEESYKTFLEEWDRYCNASDVDALVSLYTDDAVRMEADHPAWIGKQAIRAGFEGVFGQISFQGHNTVEGLVASGDWAFVRGSWEGTETDPSGGEPIQISGSFMSLNQRQPDGSWKIVWDIWNRDVPLPQPD
jgi:ketosteroid isomerase-like protein